MTKRPYYSSSQIVVPAKNTNVIDKPTEKTSNLYFLTLHHLQGRSSSPSRSAPARSAPRSAPPPAAARAPPPPAARAAAPAPAPSGNSISSNLSHNSPFKTYSTRLHLSLTQLEAAAWWQDSANQWHQAWRWASALPSAGWLWTQCSADHRVPPLKVRPETHRRLTELYPYLWVDRHDLEQREICSPPHLTKSNS